MNDWLTVYQVDAFTDQVFKGNPAAVVPLAKWLPDEMLQKIAEENNLSETAFFSPDESGELLLRWFTPVSEVQLCGHATLATAYVLFEEMGYSDDSIVFNTLHKGKLTVSRSGKGYEMVFPNLDAEVVESVPSEILNGLGINVSEVLVSDDYLVVLPTQEDVLAVTPDFPELAKLDRRGVIITAPGNDVDFVSRYFAPSYGVNEDPVTGSAHCISAPYWANKLAKTELTAKQLSKRTGDLVCSVTPDSVTLKGQAVLFMKGSLSVSS